MAPCLNWFSLPLPEVCLIPICFALLAKIVLVPSSHTRGLALCAKTPPPCSLDVDAGGRAGGGGGVCGARLPGLTWGASAWRLKWDVTCWRDRTVCLFLPEILIDPYRLILQLDFRWKSRAQPHPSKYRGLDTTCISETKSSGYPRTVPAS